MAPGRFSGLSRSKRTIKGSAGGGGVKGNLSGKKTGAGDIRPKVPTVPGGPKLPTKPDYRKNPNSQLFNQGLVNLPSLKPVTGLGDPRLQGVSGDNLLERLDTYNRIATAKRPSTGLGDRRLTRVSGDSTASRQVQYNRVASGSTPAQKSITTSRAAAAPSTATKAAPKAAAPKAAAANPAAAAKAAPAVVKKATVIKKKTAMVAK